MRTVTRLARLLVIAAWATACGGVQVRPSEQQLSRLCQGVAIEVAARAGGEPSTLIELACVDSLTRVLELEPELVAFPDAGQ